MAAPKKLLRYARQWLDLFDWFMEHPTEAFTLRPFDTEADAKRMRLEFYRVRESLKSEPNLFDMYEKFVDNRELVVRQRADGKWLLICNLKSTTWIAQNLKDSLSDVGY